MTTPPTTPSTTLSLTLRQAVEATGASLSTMRRRLRDGSFPGAWQDSTGAYLVPVPDLLAAGFDLSKAPGPRDHRDRDHRDHGRDEGDQPRDQPRDASLALDDEVRRLRDELAAVRERAVRAEAIAEERAAALMRADRDAESLRLALRMLTATPEHPTPEHPTPVPPPVVVTPTPTPAPVTTVKPEPEPERRRWWQRR